jgi:hypothetical protein
LNKKTEFDGRSRGNNKLDETAIKETVKWSITEYSLFVSKIVKKGISLFNEENLEKSWFSGIKVNNQAEIDFTVPFTMENRPLDNNVIGAIGSFNLNDSQEYCVIPETNNRFVEVLYNKGEIDPDFHLKNYRLRLNNISSNSKNSNKTSIRKYDDAISIFIKNEIQKGSFLDLFEIYVEEKINILNKFD